MTREERKRIDTILKKIENYLRTLPRDELITDPEDRNYYRIFKTLTEEDMTFLDEMHPKLNSSERNELMKNMFLRTGRFIVHEYEAIEEGKVHKSFRLYIAEQA